MAEQTDLEKKQTSEDEIDLIEVALKIWAERKFILKVVGVFFVLGLIIAFGSKKEYKAETTFILEDNQGGSRMSGMLAQFGGLAGINLGGGESSDLLSPELFPNIIHSTSFLVNLAQHPVYFEQLDESYTLGEYFQNVDKPSLVSHIKGFTIGLPGKIIGLFRKKQEEEPVFKNNLYVNVKNDFNLIKLSGNEQSVLNTIKDRVIIGFDEKTGILILSAELPDPNAAAELTNLALTNLTQYMIGYQTDKALADLKFIEDQYTKAEMKFSISQDKLAYFRDRNKNVVTAKAKTEEQRLQSEYNLAYNVYNGLAQQYEQAKIEVQEKTPVFKVVNEVRVPLERSRPKKTMIMFGTIFLGVLIGLGWIIFKLIWNSAIGRNN